MFEIIMKKQNLNSLAQYYIIHDGAYGDSKYKIISGEFDIKANDTSTMKLTLSALHPHFHDIKPFESFIYVKKDNIPFFCGRVHSGKFNSQVIENNLGFFLDLNIESTEAFFNDIIEVDGVIKKIDFGVFPACITSFLNTYNKEVEKAQGVNIDFKKINLGFIDPSLTNTNHRLIKDEQDSFKTALKKFQEKISGFWWVSFDDSYNYYLNFSKNPSSQKLNAILGQNMTNLSLSLSEVEFNNIWIKGETVIAHKTYSYTSANTINNPGRIDEYKEDARFTIQNSIDSYAEEELKKSDTQKSIELDFIMEPQCPEIGALVHVEHPVFKVSGDFTLLGFKFKLSEPWAFGLTLNAIKLNYFKKIQEYMLERRW